MDQLIAAAIVILLVVIFAGIALRKRADAGSIDSPGQVATRRLRANRKLSVLPERFVMVDLETTGLNSDKHEIIEIGAILVNRDSDVHTTFQALVKPSKRIPKKITEITGITQAMVKAQGEDLAQAMPQFLEFIGDHRLVIFNAEFDMGFLNVATAKLGLPPITNPVSCALKMARRAWPRRQSYRLADLARDGKIDGGGVHRAIADCQVALLVYSAAARELGSQY
jgi:DNA polymerase III subunit epsilon